LTRSGNSIGESRPGFDRVDAAHGGIVELGYDLETGGLREAAMAARLLAPPGGRVCAVAFQLAETSFSTKTTMPRGGR
jgi:hypothetical protein